MKQRNSPNDNQDSDSGKKNSDSKKLGDKIGPAKKNDQQVDDSKEEQQDQESPFRTDKETDSR